MPHHPPSHSHAHAMHAPQTLIAKILASKFHKESHYAKMNAALKKGAGGGGGGGAKQVQYFTRRQATPGERIERGIASSRRAAAQPCTWAAAPLIVDNA